MDRCIRNDSCIGAHDGGRSKHPLCLSNKPLDRILVTHVGRNSEQAGLARKGLLSPIQRILKQIRQHHARSRRMECARNTQADAGRCTRYNGNVTVEPIHCFPFS